MQKKHQSIQDVAGIILFFGAHVYAWYSDFLIHVVSSKQRSSLRRSSATDRKKISKLVTQYQILSRQIGEEPPLEKDVLEGNFPWSALTGMYEHVSTIVLHVLMLCLQSYVCILCKGRSSVSLQQKMEVVDAYNTVERLLEEEALLIKEMVQCLSFVQEQIDEPLLAEIASMSATVHTMYGNSCTVNNYTI